jgi:hypothetical protein
MPSKRLAGAGTTLLKSLILNTPSVFALMIEREFSALGISKKGRSVTM